MLEFNILLVSNTYTNCSSLMIVLPVQIKKRTSAAQNIDATMITVNNFFLHWLKEVNIKRYPDDIRTLPTNNTIDIYRYSEKMLKHLPAKSLDTIKEMLLYNKENVIIPRGRDRRSNMSDTPADRTDANLASRIADFHSLIGQKLYYRIPLKFIFSFESNLNKLLKAMHRFTISQPHQTLKLYTMILFRFLTNKFHWMKISRPISTRRCILKKPSEEVYNFCPINKALR